MSPGCSRSDVPEMSGAPVLGPRHGHESQYIRRFRVPTNIEAEATVTFRAAGGSRAAGAAVPAWHASGPHRGGALQHRKLPEKPMMPGWRMRARRVLHDGHDGLASRDRAEWREFVARWRLEKRSDREDVRAGKTHRGLAIDPATAKRWIPHLKKALAAGSRASRRIQACHHRQRGAYCTRGSILEPG